MGNVDVLSDSDRALLSTIVDGKPVTNLQSSSGKYRELVTGILLQYADSEMAGGVGFAGALSLAPSLLEKTALAKIAYEKLNLADRTYQLVAQTGINIDKYIASHCWDARLGRTATLGYKRISADKRLNSLHFPIQGWADLAVFTYLMAGVACIQLEDFCSSSFEPWSQLAEAHLPIEESHREFGLNALRRASKFEQELSSIRLSVCYWYDKVLACCGPPSSDRNSLFLEFKLKASKNEDIAIRWQHEVANALAEINVSVG
ncbi:MAG: phenylacetate-CoA oxygenase subunit PaaI [Candidatus Obscuribacterales bacterium]|jgi:1,2-phenylacetyl-CoA epoxidase catalytic subunit|nr:phenylacetate-CoA oxygenase subunit PaaI [Candidatus Obscuribacterales bacterium]